MRYTVCFLFCNNGDLVLLQKKDRTQYAGRFNGVGGKIEPGEAPVDGARREILEETGAFVQNPIWLGTLTLPQDCTLPAGQGDAGCELHFFAGTVGNPNSACQQPGETEELTWFPTKHVLADKFPLAGDGDVEYFIAKGLRAVTG
jgi:8-oxo-dGTP pyrophosphatase MutT (NUDIX family)